MTTPRGEKRPQYAVGNTNWSHKKMVEPLSVPGLMRPNRFIQISSDLTQAAILDTWFQSNLALGTVK